MDIEGKKMNYIRKTINNYRNARRLLSSSSPWFLFLAVPLSFGAVFVRCVALLNGEQSVARDAERDRTAATSWTSSPARDDAMVITIGRVSAQSEAQSTTNLSGYQGKGINR